MIARSSLTICRGVVGRPARDQRPRARRVLGAEPGGRQPQVRSELRAQPSAVVRLVSRAAAAPRGLSCRMIGRRRALAVGVRRYHRPERRVPGGPRSQNRGAARGVARWFDSHGLRSSPRVAMEYPVIEPATLPRPPSGSSCSARPRRVRPAEPRRARGPREVWMRARSPLADALAPTRTPSPGLPGRLDRLSAAPSPAAASTAPRQRPTKLGVRVSSPRSRWPPTSPATIISGVDRATGVAVPGRTARTPCTDGRGRRLLHDQHAAASRWLSACRRGGIGVHAASSSRSAARAHPESSG